MAVSRFRRLLSPTAEGQHFNLFRWFLIVGFFVIAVTTLITSLTLSAFLENHLLRRDAAVLNDFVGRISAHHDPSAYFRAPYVDYDAPLNDFFRDIAHMPDVGRINAYAPDGTIVWSSDPTMIGANFPENDELREALEGELVFEKGNFDEAHKPEHLPFQTDFVPGWFVENYIPIYGHDGDTTVGVVEIYRIPVALAKSIRDGRALVWLCTLASGLALYLLLAGVIRRADQLIDQQHHSLLRQTRLATIGELASSVAHSIRNPIAAIRSSAELALEDAHDTEQRRCLDDIVSEVDRFDGWIRELLTFASEAGDPSATADVQYILSTATDNAARRCARQNVTLTLRPQSTLPVIRGEASLLIQVLNSLIANALDAMPEGGEISVEAATRGEGVRIRVTDTGFGIPPERLDGLFDPLVTYRQGGLGVGLALSKQIVTRYGGDISIVSESGHGTVVTIELPEAEPAA